MTIFNMAYFPSSRSKNVTKITGPGEVDSGNSMAVSLSLQVSVLLSFEVFNTRS